MATGLRPLYAKDPEQQAAVLDAAAAMRKALVATGIRAPSLEKIF